MVQNVLEGRMQYVIVSIVGIGVVQKKVFGDLKI